MKLDRKNPLYKHIYKVGNSYSIVKSVKGKRIHFKTCRTLNEAIRYRDEVKRNGWKKLPMTDDELREKEAKDYYRHVQVASGRYYHVRNSRDEYLGMSKSIEEALWFRDRFINMPKDKIPRAKDIDLQTGNPYIENGLKYPLPERLIVPEHESTYGMGSIVKKGETSFHIYQGKKDKDHSYYVCACPTYEMAHYVRQEMNKVGWDRNRLQEILDNYPKYYTKLLFMYQYIHQKLDKNGEPTGKWVIVPPVGENNGKLEHIIYSNLEDAMYDRDFLKEHDWDYDLLVEIIDDEKNPYYDMEIPPCPTRRIKRVKERDYHEKELREVAELIRQGYSQGQICEMLGISEVTLRHWLKTCWNSSYQEFDMLIGYGENPFEVLEKAELIYQPDMSRALPNNWNNWVSYLQKADRWQVRKGKETYGTYPSEKLAHKISNDLQKVNWDKSKLRSIQAKHGHVSLPFSKRWIYRQGNKWAVRRKDKDKRMISYGAWHDRRIAVIVRDMLLEHGFTIDNRDWIVEIAEWSVEMTDLCGNTMFGKMTLEDITYINREDVQEHYLYETQNAPGHYQVRKRVNGKFTSFGTYPKDKAIRVRDFLMDNNWDGELLKVMQEMGEI